MEEEVMNDKTIDVTTEDNIRYSKDGKRRLPSTAFKPGSSGNPAGRPKLGESFTDIIRERVNVVKGKNGDRIADQIIDKLIARALKGDTKAAAYLIDRVDGKSNQSMDIGLKENTDLNISVNLVGKDTI